MTDGPYLTHMRRLLEHSVRSQVTASVAYSLKLHEAAFRAASEGHLAASVAYVLSHLHDTDHALSETIAAQLEEWADNGEDLDYWMRAAAETLGVDPEKIITEMRGTYVPQTDGLPEPSGPAT